MTDILMWLWLLIFSLNVYQMFRLHRLNKEAMDRLELIDTIKKGRQ